MQPIWVFMSLKKQCLEKQCLTGLGLTFALEKYSDHLTGLGFSLQYVVLGLEKYLYYFTGFGLIS